ncbi:hypothetical protein QZH41_008431 [Actinostola sp. cb2023]|nr:hypothetical protein QZH41_008431 [Actinostola sp. cb2023]
MIAEKSLLKKKLELQAAAEELKAAAEELRLETEIAKSRAREEVYATIDAEETSLLSGTPLMKSTPLSLYIMQASGGITSNVDDTTECNETKHHEATTKDYETKHHEATAERNETKHHEATTKDYETKHHEATAERNETKHHEATTKDYETKHHEATAERNETKHHEATAERNETKHHEATTKDYETKHHEATAERNETKHHEATTERNEAKHHEATTKDYETKCHDTITEQLKSPPDNNVSTNHNDGNQDDATTKVNERRRGEKTTNNADRLYYLQQHLEGEAKDLIEGCLHLDPDEGYNEARKLLDKEYGDPYKISVAYINRLLKWPSVKYDDATGLKRLSLFLVKCMNAMKTINYMETLNHSPNMQAIVHKLPSYLQSKWREQVLNIKAKEQRIAKFKDIVKFIERAAETSNDPIYSKEALSKLDDRPKNTKSADESKRQLYPRQRTGSLATSMNHPHIGKPLDGAGSAQQPRRATSVRPCPLCERSHDLEECKEFTKKSLEEKKGFITQKGLCFACYGSNHRSKGCTNRRLCKKCNKSHPTALHIDNFNVMGQAKDNKQVASTSVSSACTDVDKDSRCARKTNNNVILHAILPVKVKIKNGTDTVTTYALYDNGSSGCFITEGLKEQLAVEGIKTTLQLGTMHGQSSVESSIVEGLIITDLNNDNPVEVARCYTRHEIPVSQEQIPTPKVVSKFDNLRTISKKIPELIPDVDVGVLIGSNCPLALEPLEVLPSGGKGPFAMRLRHGWTVSGPLHIQPQATSQGCNATSHRITVQELESIKEVITPQSVMTMFELDFNDHSSTSDDSSLSQEDKEFLSIADQGTRRVDGHYELPLPFRDPNVVMPNNRVQAEKRAGWQRKKMLRNDEYHRDYTNFINTTIAKGYTRKVPKESTDAKPGKVWYLPHHGVYHPQNPIKSGQNPIAFMADIEAMFHQVRIPENQYDFLRFLWWPDGNLDAELQEYQMTVHLFGAVSSPSSANYALRKICDDNESEYDSEVTDTIKRNFYVDDCLRSVKTKATAIELVNDIRQACAQGGFNLTKFICNDRDVLESIPLEHRSKEVKSLDLECDDLPIERALGVQWCVETDIFQFKFRITVSNKPLTRRGILSTVSSIYDPLGILSPFTLVAKKLLQELCCEKAVGWDAEIPEHYLVRWDKWQRELPLLERLILNRCLTPSEFGEIISQQVHVFSDASSTGYGAVAYLRQCDNENRTHCAFLMGKARLAPIKTMTIPRLELTAATVSTRMGHLLKSELDENPSFTYHTDSTTVLRYIANQQTRFKVFVSNRVQTIRDLTDVGQWRYVDTKENPADDASRGLGAQSLLDNKRWLNGPKFLLLTEHEWPEQPFSMGEVEKDDPEVKGATCAASSHATLVDHSAASVDKLIRHYSDWYRLKKAVAVFLRVRKILRERAQKRIKVATNASEETKLQTATDDQSSQLTVQDLQEAELAIVQYVQSQAYGREIQVLDRINEVEELHDRTKRKMIKTEIKKTSSIYCCLDPYLDQGTLRVGGRLSRANLPPHSVHPIILPRERTRDCTHHQRGSQDPGSHRSWSRPF